MKKIKASIYFSLFFIVLLFLTKLFLFPILNNTPIPSGSYAVGTIHYYWIDSSRTEPRLPSGKREIRVEFFYPSTRESKAALFPYQPEKIDALKFIKSKNSNLPSFVWNYMLSSIHSHAEPNAPLSSTESVYPLILYLPGIGGDNLHNVYLEELASHGYIVVALEPTFDTSVTVVSDGTIVGLDPTLEYAGKHKLSDEIYAYRTKAHRLWSDDIDFVVKRLETINNDSTSPFYKKLDLKNIGFLGHSHGGAVVTDYCGKHDVCKVGINMDGWTKTVNTTQGFNKPFMFLLNEEGLDDVNELYSNMNQKISQKIKIRGAKHAAFSDYILLKKPLIYFYVAKDPESVRKQISNYLVTFFDRWLKKNKEN